MPPRWLCVAIVLGWLGFNGWLFYHDLLPRLVPGQPPPFSIDLVEEAQTRRPAIDWIVTHNGQQVFRARTRVEHLGHDSFELVAEFTTPPNMPPAPLHGFLVRRMLSRYRVNSAGDLQGLTVEIDASPQLARLMALVGTDFDARFDGEVENGQIALRLRASLAGRTFEKKFPPVQLPSGGSILLPMHPVNRLRGLAPGQSWAIRTLDPLAVALAALQGSEPELGLVRARVRPKVETLLQERRREATCLVIDYEGDGMKASTWVQEDRGLVLRQEAFLDNQHWVMNRD